MEKLSSISLLFHAEEGIGTDAKKICLRFEPYKILRGMSKNIEEIVLFAFIRR